MAYARLPRRSFSFPRPISPWLGVFAVSAIATACGGSAKAPATPAPEPPVAALPAPNLSEAPEPADIVALVRWKDPGASIGVVQAWTGIPVRLRDFVRKELPPWLADSAALEAPVDLVVTLAPGQPTEEPKFVGAIAIGLSASVEEARERAAAQGEEFQELEPGVYRLESPPNNPVSCSLAASVGQTSSRLVCGDEAQHVDELLPYLTRTLPNLPPSPQDLSAEVRLLPFEQRYGATAQQMLRMGASVLPSQFHLGEPRFDRALTNAVYGVVDEGVALLEDLDRLSIGLSARPEEATGSLTVQFRGDKSWVARTLSDNGKRAAPVSPIFFRLPKKSTTASFSVGSSPERYAAIRANLSALLDGFLVHEGVKATERQALVGLLSDKYASDAPVVSANGRYDAKARAAIVGGESKGEAARGLSEQLASSGWQILGVEEPAEKWAEMLKQAVSAYNDPGLKKQLERGFAALDFDTALPDAKLVTSPKGLPQGSLELKISFYPDSKAGQKPKAGSGVDYFVFLVPDGNQSWAALGADRETLLSHLAMVLPSGGEGERLASRAGLEKLKSGSYASAGFLTVSGLGHALDGAFTPVFSSLGVSVPEWSRMLAAAPHAGATPIIFESNIEQQGSAPTWTTELEVPKQAIEDVVATAMQVAMQKLSLGGASR